MNKFPPSMKMYSMKYMHPSSDTKIIAGNINLALDPDKDKLGGNVELHKASRQIVLGYMENYDLMDIWQNMHPEKKQFIFFKIRPLKIFSHLDFFLVSSDLIGLTKECSIFPGFKTDHSSVEFSFNIRHNSKGMGYWRFDKTLLHDSTICSQG